MRLTKMRQMKRLSCRAMALLVAAFCVATSHAALPRPVIRAFLDQHIPLAAVSAYVQEIGAVQPLYSQQPSKPMNPASTMKLVTTFAGLELLGPDYRWKTEAYVDAPIVNGVLNGNLILKGYGDPKITNEQFQDLVARLRAAGLKTIRGDLVLDRSFFAPDPYDPGAFDAKPLRPYNVGPDALLVSFKSVRLVLAPNSAGTAVDVRMDPALASVAVHGAPALVDGDCGDWQQSLQADFANRPDGADITFDGRYPLACGEREWYVAVLDHPHFVLGIFERYWADAGGSFSGKLLEGSVPRRAQLIATLQSAPLYDMVRDINKNSINVMARQLFLTLATSGHAPPATTAIATDTVTRWLGQRRLKFPELVLANGSGLSRQERISAHSMARLLLAADASKVHSEFMSSLAVAATDGTVRSRFLRDSVADQAFLKTGSLDGVRAIAGYVVTAAGRRFVVVCFVNHPNAANAQVALDLLVEWVYSHAL